MENELNAMQKAPSLVQDLGKLPPIAVAITVLLAMTAIGVLPWAGCAGLIILAWAGISRMEAQQRLKEAKARAATYANCIGPVVVASIDPNDGVAEVNARCEVWRERLELSGNPYASKIPIIAYPYDPVLMDTGEFGGGWTVYEKRVSEKRHFENIRWHEGKCPAELKALFASCVFPAPKNEFQSAN